MFRNADHQFRIIDIAMNESFVTDNTLSGLVYAARIIASLRAGDKPYRVFLIADGREIDIPDGFAHFADAYATARDDGGRS